jgi:hypothetical protein
MNKIVSVVIVGFILAVFVSYASAFEMHRSRTRGKEASFSSGTNTECGFENISLWIFEENQRGKQTSYDSVYIDYYKYNYCDGTYITGYGTVDGADFDMKNLKSASLVANGSLEIYSCNYVFPIYESSSSDITMDAGTFGDGGGPVEPCGYSTTAFSINIVWTGTTDIYRERSSNAYSTPTSRYRSTYMGKSCDANVSGTILIGDDISVDPEEGYGSLSQIWSGDFEVYR